MSYKELDLVQLKDGRTGVIVDLDEHSARLEITNSFVDGIPDIDLVIVDLDEIEKRYKPKTKEDSTMKVSL